MYYVLFIAVVNLCLGYDIAVFSGYGPTSQGKSSLPRFRLGRRSPFKGLPQVEVKQPIPEKKAVEEIPQPVVQEKQPEEKSPPEVVEKADEPPQELTSVEEAIRQLKREVNHHRDDLLGLDERARESGSENSVEVVKERTEDFKESNEQFLALQEISVEQLDLAEEIPEEIQELRQQVKAEAENKKSELQESMDLLNSLMLTEESAEEDSQKVTQETNKIIESDQKMSQSLDGALLEIARQEDRLDQLDKELVIDDLTEMSNRVGLQVLLEKWWEKDPQRSRKLTVGLIDLDSFGDLNEEFGPQVGDNAVRALADVIRSTWDGKGEVARFSGQQFFFMYPDTEPYEATNKMERLRQTIEKAVFHHDSQEVPISVSCAVVETLPKDSEMVLFKRLESTIQEAKRYGRNRTFLFEGEYPTPVVPPHLEVDLLKRKI